MTNKNKNMRGGSGQTSNPFVRNPWTVEGGGNYFKNGTPIGVGATPVFPGDASPSPQRPSPSDASVVGFSNPYNIARNATLIGGRKKVKKSKKVKKVKKVKKSKKVKKVKKVKKSKKVKKGGNNPSPLTPMPVLNGWRTAANFGENLIRQFQGLRSLPSPLPWSQNHQQV